MHPATPPPAATTPPRAPVLVSSLVPPEEATDLEPPTPSRAEIITPGDSPSRRHTPSTTTPKDGVTFSLDAEPSSLPPVVRMYLAILGWDADQEGEQFALPSERPARMRAGLQMLREARDAGKGLFCTDFAPADAAAHPRHPYLPADPDRRAFEERLVECDLPGPFQREELLLGNIVLELPAELPELADAQRWPKSIGRLYSDCHPVTVFLGQCPCEFSDDSEVDCWDYSRPIFYSDAEIHKLVVREFRAWEELEEKHPDLAQWDVNEYLG